MLLLNMAVGCAGRGPRVDVVGSDTMVNLAQLWAEAFHRRHPQISVPVSGGGSGVGIAALLSQYADVALASRPMRPAERDQARRRGLAPQEWIVGWDGLAVIVHPANPVRRVTLAELAGLFSGRPGNWRALGGPDRPVVVVSREVNSGTHVFFRETVLGGGALAPRTLKLPSTQMVHDTVARTPGAVGYIGLAYLTRAVRPLAIAPGPGAPAVYPSPLAVQRGGYPLRRPLYMYTARLPAGAVAEWLRFVTGPEGRHLLASAGFVPPLGAPLRPPPPGTPLRPPPPPAPAAGGPGGR